MYESWCVVIFSVSLRMLMLQYCVAAEREQALRRQYLQAKQQIQTLQDQCALQERLCGDARADCKDVLRLVDIMSASPAGIKNVLEAYLKKLGMLTISVSSIMFLAYV